MTNENVALSFEDLHIQFTLRGQVLKAIRGISLDVYRGESLAIVGESGSGKSVFTKSAMGLWTPTAPLPEGISGTMAGTLPSLKPKKNGFPSGARRSPWSCRTP